MDDLISYSVSYACTLLLCIMAYGAADMIPNRKLKETVLRIVVTGIILVLVGWTFYGFLMVQGE